MVNPNSEPDGVSAVVVTINGVSAKDLLTQATYQRKTSNATVKKYAREMLSGNWHFNGQPIIKNGKQLLNGAHRLKALVLANETKPIELPFVLVSGVEPQALHTMDIGKNRTLDQLLKIDGENNPTMLAKALTFLEGYRETSGKDWRASGTTVLDKYALLDVEPSIRQFVPLYLSTRLVHIPRALFVTVHYLLATTAPQRRHDVDRFMGDVTSGANIASGEAAFEFRAFVLRHANDKDQYPIRLIGNGLIEAWNLFQTGKPCKSFRKFPETCPTICK